MGACSSKKDRRTAAPAARPKAAPNHDCSKCEYVIVCCGAPKQGMGWFHATQLLSNRCPSAQLVEVVEPYLLGAGRGTADGRAFAAWAQKTSGVRFISRVADIGQPGQGRAKIALLAPRVEDAAALFHQVLETGMVTHIYLEKPGAPDLATLNAMAAAAVSHLVPVCMGYNKNMAPYVARMIQFEKQISPRACSVTFAHCDDWSNTDFLERTRGGSTEECTTMCDELMLLVAFYNLRQTEISAQSVVADLDYCDRVTDGMTTGYRRLAFEIHTRRARGSSGRHDTLCAPTDGSAAVFRIELNKCGEGVYSTVQANTWEDTTAGSGYTKQEFSAQMPDQKHTAEIAKLMQLVPGLSHNLYQQDAEYTSLKQHLAAHVLSGLAGLPHSVGSIRHAAEVMAIAKSISNILDQQIPMKDEKYPAGVYKVVLSGGIRYRNTPCFDDSDYEQDFAQIGTEFEIREFVRGEDGILYAYLWWARYFVPVRHPTSTPILQYVGAHGSSPQLEQLAQDIFHETDNDGNNALSWAEVTSFLRGSGIAYDSEKLSLQFEKAANPKQLEFNEFVDAYRSRAISDLWCIPTHARNQLPHHSSVYSQRELVDVKTWFRPEQ